MDSKDNGIFELTFIKKQSMKRPKTSSLNRTLNNPFHLQKKHSQNDPMMKMKQLKAQAKQVQQQYIEMVANINQSKKMISQNYKEIQQKKVHFLKLYQTKKLKNLQNNLIHECKTQRQKVYQKTKQNVKRQKIEQEIKRLITKQQKQTNLERLRDDIQRQKQKFQNKKFLKTKELFNNSRKSFLAIKNSHNQGQQRRGHIKSLSDVKSKHNYWKRVSQEIMVLQQYQKIIKDLEQYEDFSQIFNQPRAQTSQTARTNKSSFFLTEKK